MSQAHEPNQRPPLDPDEVTRLLKEGMRRRRPRTCAGLLFWLIVLSLPLALLVWWVWPRPAPPNVLLVTFDQTAAPGETVTLHGLLWPTDAEAADASLADYPLDFAAGGSLLRRPGQEAWQTSAVTDDDGTATVPWQAPAAPGVVDFNVVFPRGRGRSALEARGRVFTWPADTALLLVQVESTLTDVLPSAWQKRSPADIPRLPGAADALDRAAAGNYQVVYLALAAEGPLAYYRVRDWVQLRAPVGKKRFPDGPVLGRPSYTDGADTARARQEVVGELRKRFHGPAVALTRNAGEAEAFRDLGLRTILVAGKGEPPRGVIQVGTWEEVPRWLKVEKK